MHNLRALGLLFILALSAMAVFTTATPAQTPQQVVETIDIQGNRRLRDEDLMYYIKTRPGDVYDPAALERDLKELLSLNFFDKTATRVLTQQGARGGVDVIFEVKELPIIRDLTFTGAKSPAGVRYFEGLSRTARRHIKRGHLRSCKITTGGPRTPRAAGVEGISERQGRCR